MKARLSFIISHYKQMLNTQKENKYFEDIPLGNTELPTTPVLLWYLSIFQSHTLSFRAQENNRYK